MMSKSFLLLVAACVCLLFLSPLPGADFSDQSADFTHPYFSAWHPGFSSRLDGTDPFSGQSGWKQYVVDGQVKLGDISCLPVHYTTEGGTDYYFYIAQDTSGNIRYLQEGTTSFLGNPPIFFPAGTSDGEYWNINYLTGQHRFMIHKHDTYGKNGSGYGPYDNSIFIYHYWDGALMGTIVAAPRFGWVHYDGRDIISLNEAALGTVEGVVSDAWNRDLIPDAEVWLGKDPPRQTFTDMDGFYRFIDLPQKSFQLEATRDLYRDYTANVTTSPNSTTVKDVDLVPLGGAIFGVVKDALTDQAIKGAIAELDDDQNTRVQTDDSGAYRLEDVRVGSHTVKAWGATHNAASQGADVTADADTEVNFALQPIDGKITGYLRNNLTRAPIAGAEVQIDDKPETKVVTGSDGKFLIEGVSPGVHYLQATAAGYLFYQKRVTVEANQTLDMGDILLSPESTLLPEGSDFTFADGPEGWALFGSDSFDAPASTKYGYHLGLSPGGSTNCYGYWGSPFIAFDHKKTYRALFIMTSDQTDPKKVPSFRLRVNSGNNQTVAMLVVNSFDDGDSSPTTDPRTYGLVFSLPASSSTRGFSISFDIVNIGSDDDTSSWIYLESVEIQEVTVSP